MVFPETPHQTTFKERLDSMVRNSNIEIIPFKSVWEKIDLLPKGSNIAVTCSPSKGIDTTLKFIPELNKRGFRVIPHLAARAIKDIKQLNEIADFLNDQAIDEIFVIGGDNDVPLGDYTYSSKMLGDILARNKNIRSVGVGGYPEGHKKIDKSTLIAHLKEKLVIAKSFGVNLHINSQACYSPKKIISWIDELYSLGIHAPIRLGLPTPTHVIKLTQISTDIGVGDSIRFLKLTGVGSAVNSMIYDPSKLLRGLVNSKASEQIQGLHVFTFNNIEGTIEWQKNFKL